VRTAKAALEKEDITPVLKGVKLHKFCRSL